MSKKIMLLALAAVSAVMFVLPAAASANWGVTPANAAFSGTTGTGSLFASGEPTITCLGPNHIEGSYDGSGTTGSITLDFTECHTFIFGITRRCTTGPDPVASNTIASSGTFHNVTITNGKRGFLLTPVTTVIRCQSALHPIKLSGGLIGEVTSPTGACPVATTTLGLSFTKNAEGKQTHTTTDGLATEFDLIAETETTGTKVTAGYEASGTLTFTEGATIDCNAP